MSDYFNCPRCGYAPKPSDPRARELGVCADCWVEYYMQDWYDLQAAEEKTRLSQQRSKPEGTIDIR